MQNQNSIFKNIPIWVWGILILAFTLMVFIAMYKNALYSF